jgi:hypothetical protein
VKTSKRNSKKRSADEIVNEPSFTASKAPKMVSFLSSVVEKLTSELQEKANAQKEEAKEKEWTYGPRPTIDCNQITLAQVLKDIKGYTAATIDASTAHFGDENENENEIVGKFLTQIIEEFGSSNSD